MEADSGRTRLGQCRSRGRVTPLAELLAERIRRDGPLPFADYMRECLYHPVHGYYSKAESTRFADKRRATPSSIREPAISPPRWKFRRAFLQAAFFLMNGLMHCPFTASLW